MSKVNPADTGDLSGYPNLVPSNASRILGLHLADGTQIEHTLMFVPTSGNWRFVHVCNRQGGTVVNAIGLAAGTISGTKLISVSDILCGQCGIHGSVATGAWTEAPDSTGVDGHDNYALRS